jgi:hypothetical protein
MIRAVTASILHEDSMTAGREAAAELLDQLGRQPDLVLAFASVAYDPQAVLDGLYARLDPGVPLVGCSSYAEINSDEALSRSVTVMGLVLEGIEVRTYRAAVTGGDSRGLGRRLGAEIAAFGPDLVITFPDGVHVNSTPYLLGLQEHLGDRFPIVGGVAADMATFTRTHELHHREALTGHAVAVALKGALEIAAVAKSGFHPIGVARKVTRVENAKAVIELDGQPALGLYKDYLGLAGADLQTAGLEFPLGIAGSSDAADPIVRAVQGVDEARSALLCSGDVPEGADVRMMRGTKDDLIQGAAAAVDAALQKVPDPSVALFFDCMGRKLVLGARYKEELAAVVERLGAAVPKIGFYTYGELALAEGISRHHDETFTMVLLRG